MIFIYTRVIFLPSLNAEIPAFLHTAVIYVNAEILAFVRGQIFVNAEISSLLNPNTSDIFVNAEISAFTNILTRHIFVNADISTFTNMSDV